MKALFDFFPILLFFIAFKWKGIFVATIVIMVASCAQIGWVYWHKRRVEMMHLISFVLIAGFGLLTLILADQKFIMWKPTILNGLLAVGFTGYFLIKRKSPVQSMLESQIQMPAHAWESLHWIWVGFFLVSGAANLWAASGYFDAEAALLLAHPEAITQVQAGAFDCPAMNPEFLTQCQNAQQAQSFWASFKFYGLIGMTLVFALIQGLYLSRHMASDTEELS